MLSPRKHAHHRRLEQGGGATAQRLMGEVMNQDSEIAPLRLLTPCLIAPLGCDGGVGGADSSCGRYDSR
jgi:hypothetical protein